MKHGSMTSAFVVEERSRVKASPCGGVLYYSKVYRNLNKITISSFIKILSRQRYKRHHTGFRQRTTIYINKEVLNAVRRKSAEEKISVCDYIERAISFWLGITHYTDMIRQQAGGIHTTVIHLVDHVRRDVAEYVKLDKFQQKHESSATFDPEGWYCPNCKRLVTATRRAMRIRCVRCNSPVQLKRRNISAGLEPAPKALKV